MIAILGYRKVLLFRDLSSRWPEQQVTLCSDHSPSLSFSLNGKYTSFLFLPSFYSLIDRSLWFILAYSSYRGGFFSPSTLYRRTISYYYTFLSLLEGKSLSTLSYLSIFSIKILEKCEFYPPTRPARISSYKYRLPLIVLYFF